MKTYLVGGAVRDKLLGLKPRELDYVVVGATPEEMEALGFKPVGADFPVFLHPETHAEYALARTERKTGRGYKGFTVYASPDVTLNEDLRRRDLTINAIAEDADGKLIDPFGGRADLHKKTLRHVSPAFSEDPVRILRIARFMARFALRGFRLAPETKSLMSEMVRQGEVDALVPERVWAELEKALNETRPGQFFAVLRDCGALACILPELDELFSQNRSAYNALDRASMSDSNAVVRFAVLVSHLEIQPTNMIMQLCHRMRAPKEYVELSKLVAEHYHFCLEFDQKSNANNAMRWLERLDAFRRPKRVSLFLSAINIRLQTTLQDSRKAKGIADSLEKVWRAAHGVDIGQLVPQLKASGFEGAKLGELIRNHRQAAVAGIIAQAKEKKQ